MQDEVDFVDNMIELTCEKNNVPELYSKIKFKFVHSLPDEFCRCYLSSKRIEISRNLWNNASLKEKRNAIVHETSHIIARYKFGTKIKDHGIEWSSCVKAVGEVPHIFFHKEGVDVYVAGCKCKKRSVSKDEYEELKSENYKCGKCGVAVFGFSE